MRHMTQNQEYLAALVHGRRSRMAEGPRLRALCQMRALPDFALEVVGESAAASEVQRKLVQRLAREVAELAPHLAGAAADLLQWLVVRFQVEDLKLFLRRLLTQAPLEEVRNHLVPLPAGLELDTETLAKAESLETLAELMPRGALRREFGKAMAAYHDQPRSFYFEAALDRGYFGELLVRVNALAGEDAALVRPIAVQEVDTFHLSLVIRGRFLYHLAPESLQPLHLPGTRIPRDLFDTMLAEGEIEAAAHHALGRVVERLGSGEGEGTEGTDATDPGTLERLAWTRFWRLANRAFRCSHMGAAAVVAYAELRRMEVGNLMTVCEGIQMGVAPDALYARLIPLTRLEAVHV